MLTQEDAKELFNYDVESGNLIWKKKPGKTSGRVILGGIVGHYHKATGYLVTKIRGQYYKLHRLVWLWMFGYLPENQLDHINRVRNDNRIENLREVSQQCNSRNSCVSIKNTSSIKGVSFDTVRQKYSVRIKYKNKYAYLGRYDNFEEAVCARLAAEQCLNWHGCDSSSSSYKYVRDNIQKLA